ncbi:MAG: MBL fold metallo-hydrolase [Gammaproteobacteria bacterium]|nr:MBL fold metallo-hydrolase [Gammaproteobacteria bacterium]MAY02884.1 MBL fold metallo-hydrolase [Gammaproteobacteria bacterium]|tara:strand:- start:47343 stop:48698 length:1356 start_codon:yes stop_codon:yes gene_type:complete
MKIHFLGGAETVTGSKYLVKTQSTTVLIDCGLFQGYKWLRDRNWDDPLFDVGTLDAVILTHAHLDHSGYIPVLYKKGYRNPVYTHHATKDLCNILLPDSGHIQEEDAKYISKHKIGKRKDPQPLYTRLEAVESLRIFQPVDFEKSFSVGDIKIFLQSAGHILGAASIIIEAGGKRIGFSGDVGRPDDIFMRPPALLPELDLLMLESTYGNRSHGHLDPFQQLAEIVNETAEKGGVILIPSFAVGRAQTIMHILATLKEQDKIHDLPVFLDSPMAINVSDIYCKYADQHRLSNHQCHKMCGETSYTQTVDESKALAELNYPHIIIAGSGMATGGRILHHMKRLLGNHKTTLLFTGYQAAGTRGAKMLEGGSSVRIHGQDIPCRARVEILHGLSGHGDFIDIEAWLNESPLSAKTAIRLVHGDPEALQGMKEYLRQKTSFDIEVARYRGVLTI